MDKKGFWALLTLGIIIFLALRTTPHQTANDLYTSGRECEDKMALVSTSEEEYKILKECAIKKYEQAIEKYTKDWRYYYRLAEVVTETDTLRAIDLYVAAIKLAPSETGPPNGIKYVADLSNPDTITVDRSNDIFREISIKESEYTLESRETETILIESENANKYYNLPPATDNLSIQLKWEKEPKQWASLIFGLDTDIHDSTRATKGGMTYLDLSHPEKYALQFAIRGVVGQEKITIKFQDQNIIIRESIGNQVIHEVTAKTEWKLYCVPLNNFTVDTWVQELYGNDHEFQWKNIKQINFDPYYDSKSGTVYLDEIRIVEVSECTSTDD